MLRMNASKTICSSRMNGKPGNKCRSGRSETCSSVGCSGFGSCVKMDTRKFSTEIVFDQWTLRTEFFSGTQGSRSR